MFEKELLKIVASDTWMLDILKIVRDLNLNDCWIGAGFVRNKVWDVKHDKTRTKLNDIDVIFHDDSKFTKEDDKKIEIRLKEIHPDLNWSVKNQSRMHLRNGHQQYKDCNEAISFWPETATAVAIRLNSKNSIEYIAPYGLNDLFNLLVIPSPKFNLTSYKDRIQNKNWIKEWNKLNIKSVYKNDEN